MSALRCGCDKFVCDIMSGYVCYDKWMGAITCVCLYVMMAW